MLNIELGNPAKRFLRQCDKILYERLMEKIRSLALDPFPSDTKRVVGKSDKLFRVRVGKCRITYIVFYNQNLLFIVDVDKRERIYN